MQGGECTVVVSFSEQDFVIELKNMKPYPFAIVLCDYSITPVNNF